VPAETALAHPGLIGEDRKRKIARQMPVVPIMERAELVVGYLQSQGRAELCLPAGTLEEDVRGRPSDLLPRWSRLARQFYFSASRRFLRAPTRCVTVPRGALEAEARVAVSS